MLPREEYVEQAYFFRTLRERMQQNMSTQELLGATQHELLATTRLPLAVSFMRDEINLSGKLSLAMSRIPHYFAPFQTFVIEEAEREEGRFDIRIAFEVLEREAEYRAAGASVQGIFFYQFECISRNRLGYDRGLTALAGDEIYNDDWREWLRNVRRQVGLVDFCDMIYVRSEFYRQNRGDAEKTILFGEKEGRIAMANRRKDPLHLFAALQRHLGYPAVPRPRPEDVQRTVLPNLLRRVERLETRIKLLEEELRGGINLARFYGQPKQP
ncbi:MAG: hypothetical protein ACOY3P_15550 [Planctomycetota bacterium]